VRRLSRPDRAYELLFIQFVYTIPNSVRPHDNNTWKAKIGFWTDFYTHICCLTDTTIVRKASTWRFMYNCNCLTYLLQDNVRHAVGTSTSITNKKANVHAMWRMYRDIKSLLNTRAICFSTVTFDISSNVLLWHNENVGLPDNKFVTFLSRVSTLMLTRDIDIAILSVCPSVTRWYCMKTA